MYRGKFLDLGVESVALPNGEVIDLDIVRHPGGAAVVAVDEDSQVCLLRQFRHATGGWLWELPAGKLDPGEAPLSTARRELEEEAGVGAASWQGLGSFYPTPGFCDEVVHLFLARGLARVPSRPGPHEIIEVHWLDFAQTLERARSGELRDAKTVIALFRAERLLLP